MVNPNRFYTYAYLREDMSPYYIGKGKGNRAYRKGKNEVKLPKDKSRIIFLKQKLTEQEAFEHEEYMISVFGRKDLGSGILHNRTDGGEGFSGWVPSEETRKNWSEIRKGENNPYYGKNHSQETREKMSKSHMGRPGTYGMLGKSHTEEAKQKLRENEGNKLGGAKSAKIINSRKWMCLETGYITTSGPLTQYQRARGIDTSKRKRIE